MRSRVLRTIPLIILTVMMASLTLAAPAAQAQGSPRAESTTPAAQETGVQTIGFDVEVYRFRVDGNRRCQAELRYNEHDDNQYTSMVMQGTSCVSARMRGYHGGSATTRQTSVVGRTIRLQISALDPFFLIIYRLCAIDREGKTRCTRVERREAEQPVSINSSSLPKGGGGLFRFL